MGVSVHHPKTLVVVSVQLGYSNLRVAPQAFNLSVVTVLLVSSKIEEKLPHLTPIQLILAGVWNALDQIP